jgi:hypothetical protein
MNRMNPDESQTAFIRVNPLIRTTAAQIAFAP